MCMTNRIFRIVVKHKHCAFTFGVRLFTVLRDVHSDTLGADRCAQRDHQAHQFENSERCCAAVRNR